MDGTLIKPMCETTFLALPCTAHYNAQSSSSGQNNIIMSEVAKKQYYYRIATKPVKAYQYLLL